MVCINQYLPKLEGTILYKQICTNCKVHNLRPLLSDIGKSPSNFDNNSLIKI